MPAPWAYTSSAASTDYTITGTDGNTYLFNNNAWAPTAGPQTIYVNSNNDWEVVSTQTYDTEYYVETYPYIQWAGSAAISSYTAITGTVSETGPGYASSQQWEAAWQIYLASTPGADNGWPLMIWFDVSGVSPGGSSTPVTINGVDYDWYDPGGGDAGNHVLVQTSNTPSMTVNLLEVITWAVNNATDPPAGGLGAALSTIEFGWEVWGTGGVAETFTCTGFTLDFGGSSGSPSITTTSLPNGEVGDAYSATLEATGGVTPYTWSISSGSLPSWAVLNSGSGAITGTPAATGTSDFTVKVTDHDGNTATQPLTLTVTTPASFTPVGSFYVVVGSSTPSLTTTTTGDLVLLGISVNGGGHATAISGGGCTGWTQMGTTYTGTDQSTLSSIWAGKVATPGTATATVTVSGTNTEDVIYAQEYSVTTGDWAYDTGGGLSTASGDAFPTLTPAAAGELYFGISYTGTGFSEAGSTSGYTYEADQYGDYCVYNPNCTSAAQTPTFPVSSNFDAYAVLVKAITIAPVTSTGKLALQHLAFSGTVNTGRAGSIAVDPSTPPVVAVTGSAGTSMTTAAFSPPAGTTLAVLVAFDYKTSTATPPALAAGDSAGGTYYAAPSVYDGSRNEAAIWTRYLGLAPGAMTVTLDITASGEYGCILAVYVLDGPGQDQGGAATATAYSGTAVTAWTGGITTLGTGSWVVIAAAGSAEGTVTPNGLTTTLENEQDPTEKASLLTGRQAAATVTPGATTLGWAAGASGSYALAALEILPVEPVILPFTYTRQAVKRASFY